MEVDPRVSPVDRGVFVDDEDVETDPNGCAADEIVVPKLNPAAGVDIVVAPNDRFGAVVLVAVDPNVNPVPVVAGFVMPKFSPGVGAALVVVEGKPVVPGIRILDPPKPIGVLVDIPKGTVVFGAAVGALNVGNVD